MSEQPTTPPAPSTEPTAVAPHDAPPWGEDFSAEKAWSTIQNLRDEIKAVKADREPQDEKDARTIMSLKRQLEDAAPKLAEFERLTEASKSDLQKAQEAASKSAERATSLLKRAVQSEVKVLASGLGFADPDDAVTALNSETYATPEGDIDTDGIQKALADLLARKPHWAKAAQTPGMKPNPAQGRSASPPATVAEQIAAAQAAGDVKTALRLKASMAMHPNP